jgi:integrase
MPRLSHQTPKYRKHKASGQAVVSLNGRDHYLGPWGTKVSKLEYDRLVAEWLVNGRSLRITESNQLTVVELCGRYLKFTAKYYKQAGKHDGELGPVKAMIKMVTPLYGRTSCAEFGPLALKAVRQRMIDGKHSRSYINAQVRRIRRMFRWAAGEELLPMEIHQSLAAVAGLRRGRTEARETAPIRPVEESIVEATLPHLTSVVEAMVRFQQLTGCRPGEVCNLRPGDVDRSGEVWEANLSEHKTAWHGHTRTIYIGPQAQNVLAPYLLRGANDYCFSPTESMREMRDRRHAARKTPLSCGNRPGTNKSKKPTRIPDAKYTTQSYGRAISRACELAFPHETLGGRNPKKLTAQERTELREWNKAHRWAPNQLRHALATKVRKEFDIDAAKTLLGHQSIGVTEVYAEKDRGRAIQVAAKIG